MNLPNKLTMVRIGFAFVIIALLLFPFDAMGITLPKLFVDETIVIDIKYIISGVLFVLASLTDFLDGYIARKYHLVTDFGKMIDAIADKILKKEPGFVEKYIEMLKQGCSKKSIELLKMVEVDLETTKPYEAAIQFYQEKIEALEKFILL